MTHLYIDQGYSSVKLRYANKLHKFPTAICFASDSGIQYGEEGVFEYQGQKYLVGPEAAEGEAFSTGDYSFKSKFDPLLLFFILSKLNLIELAGQNQVQLHLTLALADWKHNEEYLNIFKNFTVNGIELSFANIDLMPQGSGSYINFVTNQNNNQHPKSAIILDIGAVTINMLAYKDGKPQRQTSKGFPGHGVMISVIQPFRNWLETKFSMHFDNSEAMVIFMDNQFIFNGIPQEEVIKKIAELKNQFIHKLFNSVLTSEKKTLSTAEKVIFAGGGCYLLEGVQFAPNTILTQKPYEFANVLGG